MTFFAGLLILLAAILLGGWFQTAFVGCLIASTLLLVGAFSTIYFDLWFLLPVTILSLVPLRIFGLEPSVEEIFSRVGNRISDRTWIKRLKSQGSFSFIYLRGLLGSGLIAGWLFGYGFWIICSAFELRIAYMPAWLFALVISVVWATSKYLSAKKRWRILSNFEV